MAMRARVGAGDAAADDDDLAGLDAGNAAEKNAASALLALERVGAGLDRHASRDFTHRRQKR